jgi:uncharacterized pyridoxamine 5'-phosphate oxidase family protein
MVELKHFAPTEMQHDFGTDPGISKTRINASHAFNNNEQLKKSVGTNAPLEAMTDHELIIEIFGQRTNLAEPTEGTFSKFGNLGIWKTHDYKDNNQTWEIRSASADGLRGEKLARELGIPNRSVAIVDFDKGIIDKRLKAGPPSDFLLFLCINNITRADSAGKKNVHKNSTAGELFSSFKGITCKGLVSDQEITVNANNQLRMNYTVKNKKHARSDVITQSWEAVDKVGVDNNLQSFVVNNSHVENNITRLKNEIATVLLTNGSLGVPNVTAIKAFLKKRSGDYFQGWITKYLLKKVTDNVDVYFFHKPGARYVRFDTGTRNLQKMSSNNKLGDIFTVTHDYPYLCFCVHVLGVSVLFRSNDKIIYFRKITPSQ